MYCNTCGTKIVKTSKFCTNCGASVDETLNASSGVYFSVSTPRLITLSFFTFGLYPVFWFYKNFTLVKNHERSNTWPIARAIFYPLFSYGLFKKIQNSAKKHNYPGTYSAAWLTVAVIAVNIYGIVNGLATNPWVVLALIISALLLSAVPLLPVQKAIVFNNTKVGVAPNKRPFLSWGEITCIILGVLFIALAVLGVFAAE